MVAPSCWIFFYHLQGSRNFLTSRDYRFSRRGESGTINRLSRIRSSYKWRGGNAASWLSLDSGAYGKHPRSQLPATSPSSCSRAPPPPGAHEPCSPRRPHQARLRDADLQLGACHLPVAGRPVRRRVRGRRLRGHRAALPPPPQVPARGGGRGRRGQPDDQSRGVGADDAAHSDVRVAGGPADAAGRRRPGLDHGGRNRRRGVLGLVHPPVRRGCLAPRAKPNSVDPRR
ncbi:hypothetical protein PVAP13_4KG036558 [Panicum virgatum]|uniref:Uncharacterized protein n=1 Tax=Panicum virgatum TaxID=38727 RepID=A0A8T0TC52_PANVG|nr:hypothetical protein PVAP13_4KG036558 [Panicum virgatum]